MRLGFLCYGCLSGFSPFPRNKVSLGDTRLEYPRDMTGTGQEASEVGNAQPDLWLGWG